MFGFRITTNNEIIDAIKTVEELRKVNAILRNDLGVLEGGELCKDLTLTSYECRHMNIERSSCIASILSLHKEINK